MRLEDLGLPTDVLADAERWRGEMAMEVDEFHSYMVETYGPEDHAGLDDRTIYRQAILWAVDQLRYVEAQADPV